VGYTGGSTKDPTYYNLADHTETVQLDYDPAKVDYEELVESFFGAHDATGASSKQQYMSAIFVHDAEQERVARAVMQQVQAQTKRTLKTQILPAGEFYLAEDYHQKYALRGSRFFQAFQAMYPDFWDIVDSPAATRVNAYVYGFGTEGQLADELDSLGLSAEAKQSLGKLKPVAACPID
jgi:methionine-S-sulfoxide reductase